MQTLPMLAVMFSTAIHISAFANDSLLWLTEFPPAQSLQVLDINDSTFQLLEQQLPTLNISRQQATAAQYEALLKHKPNVCVGNKLPLAERRQWGVISHQPQVIFPGLRLYVLRSSGLASWLTQLSHQRAISLQRLLETNHKFKLGFAAERSYGVALDRLLQQAANQRNLFSRAGPEISGGILHMFTRGRIDLLIEYPNVVQHYLAQLPEKIELVSFALQESPALLPGHIICSDTPQGRALLSRFDHAISVVSQQRRYLDAHLRWFSPDLHQELTTLYNTAYGTNF